jgi:hypothetical protein
LGFFGELDIRVFWFCVQKQFCCNSESNEHLPHDAVLLQADNIKKRLKKKGRQRRLLLVFIILSCWVVVTTSSAGGRGGGLDGFMYSGLHSRRGPPVSKSTLNLPVLLPS